MYQMGSCCSDEGDYKTASEYWTKAAALGEVGAHYQLSVMYSEGVGVEKDKKKGVYHLEQAAIGGDPDARHNLGVIENDNGRYERAAKLFIIAAKLGCDNSLDALKGGFKGGIVTKDDLTAALRGHQAAIDAAKSPQRDAAEAVCKFIGERRN